MHIAIACRPFTHTEFKAENGVGTKSCNPLGAARKRGAAPCGRPLGCGSPTLYALQLPRVLSRVLRQLVGLVCQFKRPRGLILGLLGLLVGLVGVFLR